MRAVEDLTMIEVQIGTELIEEDIVRIEKNWDKILLMCNALSKSDKEQTINTGE